MNARWSVPQIAELIQNVPDFPRSGVMFKDITPIMENGEAFRSLAQHMREHVFPGTTKLLAIESRGFILAAALAQYVDAGIVLARKPGKLPRATISVNYELEYSAATLQVHTSALGPHDKVTIIDDVLATGGTAHAAESLVVKAGAKVLGSCFMMELTALRGGQKLNFPYHALLKI
ncbi:MAG: adenine phosphoribosyltransferase [Bdellovibrionales bacterium]